MNREIKLILFILPLWFSLTAQEVKTVSTLTATSAQAFDSVLVISTLGHPVNGAIDQPEVYTSTEVFPFLLRGQTTSIQNPEQLTGITIWPNPARNDIHIRRNENTDLLLVRLYQCTGQQILEKEWASGLKDLEVSLGDWPVGVFELYVTDIKQSKRKSFTILKQ